MMAPQKRKQKKTPGLSLDNISITVPTQAGATIAEMTTFFGGEAKADLAWEENRIKSISSSSESLCVDINSLPNIPASKKSPRKIHPMSSEPFNAKDIDTSAIVQHVSYTKIPLRPVRFLPFARTFSSPATLAASLPLLPKHNRRSVTQ